MTEVLIRATCLIGDWLYKKHFILEHRLPGKIRPPFEERVIKIFIPINLQVIVSIHYYGILSQTLTLRPVMGSLTK